MTDEEIRRMIAVMKSYERKSGLAHYDMWGKLTGSYNFKVKELKYVTKECAQASQSGALALDAGCGVGVYSSMLASKGFTVMGIDASFGMLKKAKALVKGDNVFFIRGSITRLPFRQSEFDLIVCVDTLHHFTRAFFNEAIREFRSAIKVGGVFITDTRNSLNPLLLVQYWLANSKWNQPGGLTLEARSLMHMKRVLRRHGFRFRKSLGIGFAFRTLAPYIVIVSEASIHRRRQQLKNY